MPRNLTQAEIDELNATLREGSEFLYFIEEPPAMTDAPYADLVALLLRSHKNKTLVHWAHGKEAADALTAQQARISSYDTQLSCVMEALGVSVYDPRPLSLCAAAALAQARKSAFEEAAALVDQEWAKIKPGQPSFIAAAIRARAEEKTG